MRADSSDLEIPLEELFGALSMINSVRFYFKAAETKLNDLLVFLTALPLAQIINSLLRMFIPLGVHDQLKLPDAPKIHAGN